MQKLSTFFVAVSILFSACQKSSPAANSGTGSGTGTGGNTGQPSGNLVRTITLISYDSASGGRVDSMVIHYGYDGQNRMASNVQDMYTFSTPSAAGQLTTIDSLTDSYAGATISETQQTWTNGSRTQTIANTFSLDATGKMADSSHKTTTNYSGSNSLVTQEESAFTYDGNGYLTRQDNFLLTGGQTVSEGGSVFTISNGNTVLISTLAYLFPGDTSTAIRTAIQLGYSNQPANAVAVVGNSLNYIGVGSIILGHPSVDLFNSFTFSSVVGGTSYPLLTELFTYTLDSQNRVSGIVYKEPSGNLIAKAYYVY